MHHVILVLHLCHTCALSHASMQTILSICAHSQHACVCTCCQEYHTRSVITAALQTCAHKHIRMFSNHCWVPSTSRYSYHRTLSGAAATDQSTGGARGGTTHHTHRSCSTVLYHHAVFPWSQRCHIYVSNGDNSLIHDIFLTVISIDPWMRTKPCMQLL